MHPSYLRLKFANPVGGLALIEGTVKLKGAELCFEMAMTESISGAVDGILNYTIALKDIEFVEFRKKGFTKSVIDFTAYEVSTLKRIPGSKGFKYSIFPIGKRKQVKSFVYEVLYKMTELEAERLGKNFSTKE